MWNPYANPYHYVGAWPWGYVGQALTNVPQLASPDPQEARWSRDAVQAVVNAHQHQRSPFYVYVRARNRQNVHPFPAFEIAYAWFNSIADDRVRQQRGGAHANYDYMAIFDARDLRAPVTHEFPHFWDPK